MLVCMRLHLTVRGDCRFGVTDDRIRVSLQVHGLVRVNGPVLQRIVTFAFYRLAERYLSSPYETVAFVPAFVVCVECRAK